MSTTPITDLSQLSVRNITNVDSWFRSSLDNRYVLLRGVCFGPAAKLAPHLPFRIPTDWERFETYVDLLIACGQTTLRLPFFWSAFEPDCDPITPKYAEGYIEMYFEYVRKFTDKGFFVFIDLHQDLVGKAFGGNGLPDWVREGGTKGFSMFRNSPLWGLNYVLNKPLRRTFTAFWNNDLSNPSVDPPLDHFKVRDRFLQTIERLAEQAAKNDRVLGIEIFNEPHPAMIKDKHFEEEVLPKFYGEALAAIRKYSDTLYAFVSPQSDWNANLRTDKRYQSYITQLGDDRRVVFGFHYYDSLMTGLHGLGFHDAKREEYVDAQLQGTMQARLKGMVPFLTEFGTRQNWSSSVVRRHMDYHYESVEQSLTNATYWNVNLYNTARDKDGFMREDFSLIDHGMQPRNLDIVTRPYVMLASAKPEHMEFNLRTKRFELMMRGKSEGTTTIYVPASKLHPLQPVHYQEGFQFAYNGEGGARYSKNRLEVTLDPTLDLHLLSIANLGEQLPGKTLLTFGS